VELIRRARSRRPLTLGVIDADHFKEVNSRHLLSGGDHALRWLAETLAAAVRSGDTLGRIGGEEFMLLAPGLSAADAPALAERLRQAVAAGETEFRGAAIRLTVSAGFATADAGVPAGAEALRGVADAALADAKVAGRNRCVVRAVPGSAA
jgi:diguanylate cyclase (GGDEF)-like protein